MKKGQLSEQTFSYLDNPSRKFTDNNYILVVKDEEFPNSSLLSILHFENGKVFDLNDYEMGNKILATKNSQMPEIAPLSERYSLHQLVKISTGTIIKNDKYYEGSTYPKCLTFHTNVHPLNDNEVIEIFEGRVFEDSAIFELKENFLNPMIIEQYLNTNNASSDSEYTWSSTGNAKLYKSPAEKAFYFGTNGRLQQSLTSTTPISLVILGVCNGSGNTFSRQITINYLGVITDKEVANCV